MRLAGGYVRRVGGAWAGHIGTYVRFDPATLDYCSHSSYVVRKKYSLVFRLRSPCLTTHQAFRNLHRARLEARRDLSQRYSDAPICLHAAKAASLLSGLERVHAVAMTSRGMAETYQLPVAAREERWLAYAVEGLLCLIREELTKGRPVETGSLDRMVSSEAFWRPRHRNAYMHK